MNSLKRLVQLFFYLFIFSNAFASPADTAYYSVVKGKTFSGIQKCWRENLAYHYFYSFNDRGRGDSLYEDILTDSKGKIIRSSTNGVDYFKKPFHASFEVKGDSATAITNEDVKTKHFSAEIYGGNQSPGTAELMIRAAIQIPGNKIPVFAGDTFEVKIIHDKSFNEPDFHDHLLLAETYFGKNTPPVFYWLDKDKKFFASVSDWFSTVLKGHENLVPLLIKMQDEQSLGYYSQQMNSLSEKIPGNLAIAHVRIFNSETATMQNEMTVLVEDGKVTAVGPSSQIKIPESFKVIDGKDKTLLPGLWDMHGHYTKEEGLYYLAGGVTHVRDMGNSNSLLTIRDALRKNQMLGPDISYVSGFIDKAGPYQGPTGTIINNLDEGIAAVDDYANRGYGQIKLYSSIEPAWVKPLADEAHKKGMRVAGHIPSFMTASKAVNDGYDEITHMNMVMMNFMSDTFDTRTPKRFSMVGEHAKDLDVNGPQTAQFIQLLKQKKITVDPTMNVFDGMFRVYPGDTDASLKPIVNWLPANQRESLKATSSFASVDQKPMYVASYKNMLKMLKKLYDSGIMIVSGTDGGEAIALAHELELYVEAGIPTMSALQTATWNAAKDCNLQDKYGRIQVGKEADMILVDGNPGQQISDIRRVETVIRNNYQYSPKKLFESIGWSYFY